MLEPGTWVEFTLENNVRHGRFFHFPVYQQPDLYGQEAFEAVDEVITHAVRRQLVSDVPVGSFLSGGVDSPLVTAKMHDVSETTYKAFTVGVDDKRFDESQDATDFAYRLQRYGY